MWLLSCVRNYELTGNEKLKSYGLVAAHCLAGRYNIKGEYIRAWNKWGENDPDDKTGWAIIDCMMNIPLLYWATKGAESEMYMNAAMRFLRALDERCCPWDNENDEALLNYGMESSLSEHKALIYGDYYFLEAILKIKNM